MGFIDADTHVDETLTTWDFIAPEDEQYRPILFDPPGERGFMARDSRPHRLWLISGTMRLKRHRDDVQTGTTAETRELLDVPARLRQMDELGCDVQVIYPTMFIHVVTDKPEVEAAVHGAYNRWLADRTAETGGRLRWAYIPPILSIERAVRELAWAKEHGACAVMKKGVEYERAASDPYFYPLYREAERLDLPVCFHTGDGDGASNTGPHASMQHFNVLHAFYSLADQHVPELFPALRFGFIEAGAAWIPYQLKQLGMRGRGEKFGCQFPGALLRHYRFFVTCDTEDDLVPLVEEYGAEDSLMIGTDYGHGDLSGELGAHAVLRERAESGALATTVVEKIVGENARRLYAL